MAKVKERAVTPDQIENMFTRGSDYAFARWGRPIAPIVFGVEDETLATIKGAIEAVVMLAGHQMAETDPEFGVNMMLFFFRDWAELRDVPDLDKLLPELGSSIDRLEAGRATQYRAFRFDDEGAIKAAFSFVRMGDGMEDLPAETIALAQAVHLMLTWGEGAFAETSPLALHPDNGAALLRPEIAAVIRAAYDPVMPVTASDPSHALRLFARLGAGE